MADESKRWVDGDGDVLFPLGSGFLSTWCLNALRGKMQLKFDYKSLTCLIFYSNP